MSNPGWADLSSFPLFEFYGEGYFMEFYLNFKIPFLKGHMNVKRKHLKEVHMLVQEVTNQPTYLLPYSDRVWPCFVHLLSNEDQVMIGCDDHSL